MQQQLIVAQTYNRSSPKGYFKLIYLLIIILSANQFLNLGAWVHIAGVFNVRDMGNVMILIGIIILLFRRGVDPIIRNRVSLLILLYLFLVGIHIALASLYYGQPLIQGMLGARHHLFYLSFFLFLIILDSPEKIRRFLNMLTGLALVIIVLALINYFGPTIFSHRWAEGHGVRGGVVRGFIPGMNIVSVAAIWEFSKLTERGRFGFGSMAGLVLFVAHVFRQTRMRTVGLILVILWLLGSRKRYGVLAAVLFIGITGSVIMQLMTGKDILSIQIVTAFEDVIEGEGTWRGRALQLETALNAFMEHPVLGSGSLVLRPDQVANIGGAYNELYALQYKADLGYASWLKSFGIVGILWLFLFMWFWWTGSRKIQRIAGAAMLVEASFLEALLIFFAGTFLTLNHFMYPGTIVFVCMGAAMVVRLMSFANNNASRLNGR